MITDRNEADVFKAKLIISKGESMTEDERREFLNGLRGAYNYTDMNRVESATLYLCKRLFDIPKEHITLAERLGVAWDSFFNSFHDAERYKSINAKTDWALGDLILQKDRERYLSNVKFVCQSHGTVHSKFPSEMDRMKVDAANAIEKSLVDLNDAVEKEDARIKNAITQTAKAWRFCGDLYGGEA